MNLYLARKPKRINSVGVTSVLIFAAIVYAGWAVLPAWWPVFKLTGVMHGACNDAYRIHDDNELMVKLMKDVKRIRLPITEKNFVFTRVPVEVGDAATVNPGDWSFRRGKDCQLAFTMDSHIHLPLLEGHSITWNREVRTDLKAVKWERLEDQCTCVLPRGGISRRGDSWSYLR